tara:strand:+ start:871 stop:1326 length:456 start_codon:yes stop_codon:yes gene_type:complete
MIIKQEVLKAQKKWSDGLLKIVEKHQNNKDYTLEASNFIDEVYAYNSGEVLFKPTLATDVQFRLNKVAALSYFVGGNSDFKEDKGFALKGWTAVRWENSAIKLEGDIAFAMGNYYFKNKDRELKVEFSFSYKKEGNYLKIILHDSHFPFKK